MYSYYDPNQAKLQAQQRRDQALQRLMMIMDQHQQSVNSERVNMEKQMADQLAAQKQDLWNSMGSALGSGAQGAAIGTSISPGMGTAIGAGAGLLLGGVANAKARKDFQHAEGNDSYGWGAGLKDAFNPMNTTMSQVGGILGQGAAVGASMAGQQQAAQQANQDFAATGNAQADFERYLNTGSTNPNAVTAGTYGGSPPPPPAMEELGAGGGYAGVNATKKLPNQF